MIRINLLPHREEARKARRVQFFTLVGLVAVLGALVVLMGYTVIEGYIGNQQRKNDFLKREIAKIDKEIEEINRLKEQTDSLLARKQIIESLQRDRGETVHVLSELFKQVPDGVYLKSVKQDGTRLSLVGVAQSNSRVSTLMRNIDGSKWLEKPTLIEIKAVVANNRRNNEFKLDLNVRRPKAEEVAKPSTGGKEKK